MSNINWRKINSSYSKKANRIRKTSQGKKRVIREIFKFENYKIQDLRNFVLDLQIDLAEAIRNKNIDNCRKIINKIIKSKESRALAVYDTISKKGFRTPGVNESTPTTNVEYRQLMDEIWGHIKKPHLYRASPLHRKMVEKPQGGLRPISVPTYRDRAMQHLFKYVLEVFCEEFSDPNSFGFRKFRSPGWASKAMTLAFWSNSKNTSPPGFVFSADITKCFDTIGHDFIENQIGKVQVGDSFIETIPSQILNQWLKCGYIHMEQEKYGFGLNPTNEGVPQGGPISPVISNMALNGLESHIKLQVSQKMENLNSQQTPSSEQERDLRFVWSFEGKELVCSFGVNTSPEISKILLQVDPRKENSPLWVKTKSKNITRLINNYKYSRNMYGWSLSPTSPGKKLPNLELEKSRSALAFTARFADDFLTVTNTYSAALCAQDAAKEFLAIRGLELNLTKSKIINLTTDPFRFVGFEFRVNFDKKVIYNYPPPEKVEKVKKAIKLLATKHRTNPHIFFKEANAVLRGWCNFYRVGNSKKIFQGLNFWLWFRIKDYFKEFYSKFSSISRGSQGVKKINLMFLIWNRHWKPHPNPKRWWFVPNLNKNSKDKSGSYNGIFLIAPTAVRVATPSIKTSGQNFYGGLNAFHPIDRSILAEKSLNWQFGLIRRVLDKTKGLCKMCSCDLTGSDQIWEIHHITPIKFKGERHIRNLIPLCKECHREVSSAVQKRDLLLIQDFENRGILSGVSEQISKTQDKNSIRFN